MEKSNDIKLIICDIDGTLVNDQRQLSDLTKETIEKIHDKGIRFGVASGRAVSELQHFTNIWNLSFPIDIIIGLNGAQLWDEGQQKIFEYHKMKKEWIKEVLEILKPFDLNPYIVENGELLCARSDWFVEMSSKRNGSKIVIAKDESDFYKEEHAKIMFKISEDKIDDVMAYAKKHIKGGYMAFKTQPIMLEFTDKRTDKANALKEYAKMNTLRMDEIMAFGDMTNDNNMLIVSGIGVCLKNGSDDTKDSADLITEHTNNEDGFARFLIDNNYI